MRTARTCHCRLCKTDLTARNRVVNRQLGKRAVRMVQLVAPPRAEITIKVGKDAPVRLFLCAKCMSPMALAVISEHLLEVGRLRWLPSDEVATAPLVLPEEP